MNPHKLTLKNFHGIKAGTGLDEITIDIDALVDGDARLVLLKGENGAGKTTVLDNFTPFRLMASRASGYSPGSFSYFDHTYGDAEKVLVWSHNGIRYRTQLLIKGSGKSKKTECYLQKSDGSDNWTPVVLPDGVSSDGKSGTYDACVEHIIGTPAMFYTSAFSSQGRRQLSSYSNADIKTLMAELLALGDITDLGEKSAEVVKLLTARVNGIRQVLSLYSGKRDTRATMAADMAAAATELSENENVLALAQNAHKSASDHLKETLSLSEKEVEARQKRDDLARGLEQVRAELRIRASEINNDIEVEEQRKKSALSRYDADEVSTRQRIGFAKARIVEKDKLLNNREEIEQAVVKVADLKTRLSAAEQDGIDVKAVCEQLKAIQAPLQTAEKKVTDYLTAATQAQYQLDHLVKAASLVDQVPCVGTDLQPRCRLLADAVQASKDVPTVEATRDLNLDTQMLAEKRRDELLADIEPLKNAEVDLDKTRTRYKALQSDITALLPVAGLYDSLSGAVEERKQAVHESEQLLSGLVSTQIEGEKLQADIDKRIDELKTRVTTLTQGVKQEVAVIQEKIAAIPIAGNLAALDAAKAGHQNTQEHLDKVSGLKTTLNARVAAFKERIDVIDQELAGATELTAEENHLNSEIGHWQLLTKALGRDGIVALCIDDAGPTLATLTNDLLLSCYGPRFTVSIETQAQAANGSTRETFDIRVFDGDRNEDKSASAMSGGERIYINEALTRAIALYQAQQSGQSYGTLFSDESDGALDPKRKLMFTSMKRKVLELGGYEREIFITHTPELWDLADAVIDLDAMKTV